MGINRIIDVIPIERIRAAAASARPHVIRTPLVPVEGALLKLECLQPTGSFKVRGFFAAALALPQERLGKGLMTVSAGNAAQACAYAAHKLGVPCRVVMFDTAPQTKVAGVKRWGATPIPMPRDQLFQWISTQGWKDEPESFIHPFADEEVMAGHGGLGLELVEDVPDLRRVVVPVGGGGLIGGVASAVKSMRPGDGPRLIKTQLGFHILEVTDIRVARDMSFDEAQPEIVLALQNQKRSMALAALIEDLSQDGIDYRGR